jgi:hypothetical protein
MKGALQLAGILYKNQSILDYQHKRGESLLMQSYGQYGYQNSSVFHGTNGGQDLLHLTDDDLDTELKKNCSVMGRENSSYCKKIQIQILQSYFGGRSIAMRVMHES